MHKSFSWIKIKTLPSQYITKMYVCQSLTDLTQIYKLWDSVFQELGNNTYIIIKNWETIVQALLLKYHDPLIASDNFLNKFLEKLNVTEKKHIENMIKLLENKKFNVYQLFDLHGIYRHWGHPTVDEAAGCKKVRDIAKNRPLPDFDTMKFATGMFIRQFCISFIQQHARWPRIDYSKLSSKSKLRNVL